MWDKAQEDLGREALSMGLSVAGPLNYLRVGCYDWKSSYLGEVVSFLLY